MELKLAEYKNGKFERFLELGKDFVYANDYILVDGKFNKPYEEWLSCPTCLRSYGFATPITLQEFKFEKDKKDPLNRFNGSFNGRTYGEGRFVLIKGFRDYEYPNTLSLAHYQDSFYEGEKLLRFAEEISEEGFFQSYYFECKENKDRYYGHFDFSLSHPTGNLHESPELWEKVK